MAEKCYIGALKSKKLEFGTVLEGYIRKEDVEKLYFNDKGYANITVGKRKEVDKQGNEFYIVQSEYWQEKKDESGEGKAIETPASSGEDLEELFG